MNTPTSGTGERIAFCATTEALSEVIATATVTMAVGRKQRILSAACGEATHQSHSNHMVQNGFVMDEAPVTQWGPGSRAPLRNRHGNDGISAAGGNSVEVFTETLFVLIRKGLPTLTTRKPELNTAAPRKKARAAAEVYAS